MGKRCPADQPRGGGSRRWSRGISLSGCEQPINRQRTRASKNQREQAGDVQEIDLVSGWAELRTIGCTPDRVNGAEAVTQMDREHRYEHHANQRNAHDRNERPGQDRQTPRISMSVDTQAVNSGSGVPI